MSTSALSRSRRPRRAAAPLPVSLAATSEMQRSLEPFLGRELAPRSLDAPLHSGRTLTGRFEEVPHPSEVLTERSEWQQKLGELYDSMLDKDITLAGLVDKRKDSVTSIRRGIQAAPVDSQAAAEAKDLVIAGFSQVDQFHQVLEKMLDAPHYGISITEVMWERMSRGPWAGAWLPVDLIDRPMHRFAFERRSHRLHIRQPQGRDPIPAPPMKFVVLRHGTKDNPWGKPGLDRVYWFWWIAKHSWKYYAVWLERWAQPLGRVKYRHTGDDKANAAQIDQALDLIAALQTDQGVAVPDKLELDYMESSRNGSISYDAFVSTVQAAYALYLLGEVDTSGLGDQPGSYAKSAISNTVRLEKRKKDSKTLDSGLSETLVRWMVWLNLGLDAPMPRYVIHSDDLEDRSQRSEGIEKAQAAGLQVPVDYARRTWQVPAPLEGEEVLEPPAPAAPSGGLFPFAAPRPAVHLADGDDPADIADDPETVERAEAQAAELDAAAAALLSPTLDYYEAHRQAVLAAWDEGAGDQVLSRAVERLGALPRVRAQSLAAAAIHGAGLALWQLREEDEAAAELAAAAAVHLAAPPASDYSRADTPEAAIEYWARLLRVDKSLFSTLDDQARRLAFTVAGAGDGALLTDLHQLVQESIAEGVERSVFVERVDALYERHGVTPSSRWHAELVYDNMVRQAHGATFHQQVVRNPAAVRLTPYVQFVTLDDGRVRRRRRHNHAVMHGYIAAVDHPVWRVWGIPAGHSCRCRLRVINVAAARRMGLTGSEPMGPWPTDPLTGGRAMPDPGFAAAADLSRPLAASADRARQTLDSASGDLGRALETLFGVLSLFELLGGA